MNTARMPALFLAHGNPMNALTETVFSADWHALLNPCPTPRAILCISAHWETRDSRICAVTRPDTIHDFRGFPPALFAMRYPCPGAPELAAQIAERVPDISLSEDWGLDHGSWSLLAHLFPTANIPVLQLSLARPRDAAYHYALGEQLRWLRNEGVLIIGSGNIVHNLQRWFSDPRGDTQWAKAFDNAIAAALQAGSHQPLVHYHQLPEAAAAVPTPEHFLPLLYIAALQQADDALRMSQFPGRTLEEVCMRSVRIG